jgi:cytochrome c
MRALLLVASLAGCADHRAPQSFVVDTGGNSTRGRSTLVQHGCHACHDVPDVDEPGGDVGPPLKGFAARTFIAGRLPNTPANLISWIRAPHHVDASTAMPDLGLTEEEARDVAAYLYTLH